jgi:hypothetical protein
MLIARLAMLPGVGHIPWLADCHLFDDRLIDLRNRLR